MYILMISVRLFGGCKFALQNLLKYYPLFGHPHLWANFDGIMRINVVCTILILSQKILGEVIKKLELFPLILSSGNRCKKQWALLA